MQCDTKEDISSRHNFQDVRRMAFQIHAFIFKWILIVVNKWIIEIIVDLLKITKTNWCCNYINKVPSFHRYVAGRMNLISQTETKGLSTFVGSFSLPALIFLSLAELDLSSVNWMFLLSVLVAKTVVFLVVVAVTLLVSRPVNTGRAGLFAIFCTQSNDFAIGYPIGKW